MALGVTPLWTGMLLVDIKLYIFFQSISFFLFFIFFLNPGETVLLAKEVPPLRRAGASSARKGRAAGWGGRGGTGGARELGGAVDLVQFYEYAARSFTPSTLRGIPCVPVCIFFYQITRPTVKNRSRRLDSAGIARGSAASGPGSRGGGVGLERSRHVARV